MTETVKIRSELAAGVGAFEVPVGDVVLTFRSVIDLVDGRIVRSRGVGFLGPTADEITKGGGSWYLVVYPGTPESDVCEWISNREIAEILVVGTFDEWPALDDLAPELEDDLAEVMAALDEALYQAEPIYWIAASDRVAGLERKREELRRRERERTL